MSSSTVKIGVGVGLLAASVVAALLGPRLAKPRVDPVAARETALGAGKVGSDAIREHLGQMESAVLEAAALEPLRAAIRNRVDANTLVDLFTSEDWWHAQRKAYPLARVIVGSSVASFGQLPLGERDQELIEAARKERVASGLLLADGRVVQVAATRIDGRGEAVLVLAAPLEESALRGLNERTRLGLVLVGNGRALMSAAPEQPGAVDEVAKSAAETLVRAEAGWVAASHVLSPGLRLWSLRPLAPVGGGGTPIGVWIGVAIVAVAGVAVVVSARPRASSAVPRAEMPRENTMPFGTNNRNRQVNDLPGARTDHMPLAAPPPHKLTPLATSINPSEKPRTFGRYRLIDILGVGGMSEVYTAMVHGAEGFQRTFVVKRLKPELRRDKEAVSQFIDEARIQSVLQHSNIVPVFDFGTMGDEYYMAQEYVVGRDLMRLSTRCIEKTNFCLDPRIVYYIAHETLQALAYAHSRKDKNGTALGIVHRDVSASNIMVTAAGDVRLFDFGIAKAQKGPRAVQTQAGLVKGNANFMSPEQARGQEVDARSDLFSLGMVIYYCLTGCLFYNGDNDLDVLYRAACGPTEQDLAGLDQLPGPAAQLLRKALAFKPEDRFQSAEEFAAAVAGYAVGMKGAAAKMMEDLFGPELHKEAA